MKILFVENRYKTGFWELIAQKLVKDGHEVCWIVQNHLFKPTVGEVWTIPYFKGSYSKNKTYDTETIKIISSNRGLNYFGIKSDDFIFYYRDEISKIIEVTRPDIAFGESTLFHELLIINECRNRNILYLHPTSCRYPTGRFSFYLYDTLQPYGGSEEELLKEEALYIINQIVTRSVVPDYMKVLKPAVGFGDKITDKWRLTKGYIMGERFNTPSPFIKRKVEQKKEQLIELWDNMALESISIDDRFKLLYPMQMQPEANIDVWGYPYNNQLETIKRVTAQLTDNDVLYLKANPKSKYEITEELLLFAKNNSEKIILLKHSVPMQDVFAQVDFVITITGTISFECIWADKPFITLGGGLQKEYSYTDELQIPANKPSDYPGFSENDKISLIRKLMATSFKGNIGDTFTSKHFMNDKDNMEAVFASFDNILKGMNLKIAGKVINEF